MGLITDCTSFPSHNSRELISIQAGPASNWVGAHIWNLHENIIQKLQDNCFNPNVFSRSNEEGSVTSFRPRLIAIDTLGSLYSPQLEHTPTFSSLTHATWDGDIQTVKLDGYMCPPESTKFVFVVIILTHNLFLENKYIKPIHKLQIMQALGPQIRNYGRTVSFLR